MYSKPLELTRWHKCSHALSSIASMFMISKRLDPKSAGLSNTCAMILLSIKQHPLKTAWAAYYNKKTTSWGWPKSPTSNDLFVGSKWSIKVCGKKIPGFLMIFVPFQRSPRRQTKGWSKMQGPHGHRNSAWWHCFGLLVQPMAAKSWIPPRSEKIGNLGTYLGK